jgi:Domain of unknown function (DUF4123)
MKDSIEKLNCATLELERAMSSLPDGIDLLAIIDPASYPNAWLEFGQLAASRKGGSLFAQTPHDQDTAVAPLLLPLEAGDEKILAALVKIAHQSPAIVWVTNSSPTTELLTCLALKLDAELADERLPITLRYFDPRVLPELLHILDSQQLEALNGGVRAWWWMDRNGKLTSFAVNSPQGGVHNSPLQSQIALSNAQIESLLEASFVDRVLEVLLQSEPHRLAGFDLHQRYAIAAEHVAKARDWGLHSEFDCASYLAVSFELGRNFAASPEWTELLERVKLGELGFSAAIEEWEAQHAGAA